MYKLYSKLWSSNKGYFEDSIEFFKEGLCQGIELYSCPGSYNQTIGAWQELNEKYGIPFIIHAPHFYSGFNFAKAENFETNKALVEETVKFSNALDAKYIVFHPGAMGDIKETVRQINYFKIENLLIENKPYLAYEDKDWPCNGYTPEEISYVLNNTNAGFCLDVGHAMASANSQNKDPYVYAEEFMKLSPAMFHLSDGDEKAQMDYHWHLGRGSFDLERILNMIPYGAIITLETEKNFTDTLSDFKADIEYINNFIRNRQEEKII